MKRMKSNWVRLVVLFTVIFLCGCSIQVVGKERKVSHEDERYYQVMEKEYRSGLRNFLDEAGYYNSGINMTKVISPKEVAKGTANDERESQETRTYTVSIYNKKISQLDNVKRSELMSELVKMEVLMNGFDVSYEFMETDV